MGEDLQILEPAFSPSGGCAVPFASQVARALIETNCGSTILITGLKSNIDVCAFKVCLELLAEQLKHQENASHLVNLALY